jgi:hypothetical protein
LNYNKQNMGLSWDVEALKYVKILN